MVSGAKTNRFVNILVVLVEPSHPGNLGAVARAMKTMCHQYGPLSLYFTPGLLQASSLRLFKIAPGKYVGISGS